MIEIEHFIKGREQVYHLFWSSDREIKNSLFFTFCVDDAFVLFCHNYEENDKIYIYVHDVHEDIEGFGKH